jgi:hypothetical protein
MSFRQIFQCLSGGWAGAKKAMGEVLTFQLSSYVGTPIIVLYLLWPEHTVCKSRCGAGPSPPGSVCLGLGHRPSLAAETNCLALNSGPVRVGPVVTSTAVQRRSPCPQAPGDLSLSPLSASLGGKQIIVTDVNFS